MSYNGSGNDSKLTNAGPASAMAWVTAGLFALGGFTASGYLTGLPIAISVPLGGFVGGMVGLAISGGNPLKLSGGGMVSQVVMASLLTGMVVLFFGMVGWGVIAGAAFLLLWNSLRL